MVAQQGFGTSRRGFDRDEVRAFLTRVAEQLRSLSARERQLQVQLDAMSKARFAKENLEADLRAEAKVKGYEGESCRECGNFTLLRNGTCMKCDTCGGTSGCS